MSDLSTSYCNSCHSLAIAEAFRESELVKYFNETGIKITKRLAESLEVSEYSLNRIFNVLENVEIIERSQTGEFRLGKIVGNDFDAPQIASIFSISPAEVLSSQDAALLLRDYIELTFFNNPHPKLLKHEVLRRVVTTLLILVLREVKSEHFDKVKEKVHTELAAIIEKLFISQKWLSKKTKKFTKKGKEILIRVNSHELSACWRLVPNLISYVTCIGKSGSSTEKDCNLNSKEGQFIDHINDLITLGKADFDTKVLSYLQDKREADLTVVDLESLLPIEPETDFLPPKSRLCYAEKKGKELFCATKKSSDSVQGKFRSDSFPEDGKVGLFVQALSGKLEKDNSLQKYEATLQNLVALHASSCLGPQGKLIEPEIVLQLWHEKMKDYSQILGGAPFILLQEHLIGAGIIEQQAALSNANLAKSLDRISGQMLISAEAFLIIAAGVGLFNRGPFKRYPQSADFCRLTLHCFEKRDYIIRHACNDDLPRLYELEKLCWQHSRSSETRIRARVNNYPNGQFVIEKNGEVVGVIYSQRIDSSADLEKANSNNVHKLHKETGRIIQLLAVNVDPSVQNLNLGDELLEFMLQRCSVTDDVRKVVAVTLCKNYSLQTKHGFTDYIKLRGSTQDPILAFHDSHGAKIVKAIPSYRDEDFENQHNGVLVSYDIHHRVPREQIASSQSEVNSLIGEKSSISSLSKSEVKLYLKQEVAQILQLKEQEVDSKQPLMEMGLDSADLLKLQRLIEQRGSLRFKPGFFFEYNTIEKIAAYLLSVFPGQLNNRKSSQLSQDKTTPPISKEKSPESSEHNDSVNTHKLKDVAIIGIACKLPGGIESPEELWEVLDTGSNVIGRYPERRGNWPSNDEYPGISYGGFMQDADGFDADFFRLSPTEAIIADPQQRIMLELAWKCLENANILPEALKETDTGVFIGASNSDYSRLAQESSVAVRAHSATGSSLAVIPNRISYFFDLSGPSLLVDTACSSSLVALHSALLSLRSGESSSALVGGVNLICHPDLSLAYHKAGMLSADGQCMSFDARANGYVRSEGAVMLMLKPLAKTLSDNNNVLAVIKGSAVNHGGLAGGLTVPNPKKQSELIVSAWRDAEMAAEQMSYIEAHGTGTSLGDPIEVQGIQDAYTQLAKSQQHENTCAIGSIKSNLGHLESAAGITGLLKVILSMQHQKIPASINHRQSNPKIELEGSPFYIAKPESWTSPKPLAAGVSSFGSGGANAHIVVEQWLPKKASSVHVYDGLFVISARTNKSLTQYVNSVICWIEANSKEYSFADFIYSFQVARTPMKRRLAFKVSSYSDLTLRLKQWFKNPVADNKKNVLGSQDEHALTTPESSIEELLEIAYVEKNLELLAQLWLTGTDISFKRLHDQLPHLIPIPNYAFIKQRF
ncbi:MAG: GNAT family N-acetyltransferase, partial [Kangiellaceae bacterium]|nr:GNAT family N-acetyltransferase [Kangiellaceae bacterium]